MDSCLKLVSRALGAILKWAHLHNKQFCEKGLSATQPVAALRKTLFWHSVEYGSITGLETDFFATKEQFSCRGNPVFEICSNGFSHFKQSQQGCKSSSLVNGREKC